MPWSGGGSGSGGGSSSPGFEWSYTERTTLVAIASTTEASGTAVLSPAAFTPDGAAVLVTFYAPAVQTPGVLNDRVVVCLFEGTTEITRLAAVFTTTTAATDDVAMFGQYRFTPTNAAHTYTVTAFADVTTGSPTIIAGAGGTAGYPPCFVRFTKV